MNRNELIGNVIGKTLGYAVQGYIYCEIATTFESRSAVLLVRAGTKYGIKLIRYTSKKYARTDFSSELVFNDSIDASFDAH